MKLSPGKFRLQQISCVHCPLSLACTHNVVKLVYEEKYSSLGLFNFVEDSLKSLLKLASELGSCNQGTHIQCEYGFVLQSLRHVSVKNSLGQTLHNCSLAHAGFADENRIVLCSSGKNLNCMSDFGVSADYRIQLSLPCHLNKVSAVLCQCVIALFRILRGYSLISADLVQSIQETFHSNAVFFENPGTWRIPFLK